MRKERTLFILGIWVMVLPYTGFPEVWRSRLFFVTGLALVYLGYLYYLQLKKNRPRDDNRSKTFVDNIGSGE